MNSEHSPLFSGRTSSNMYCTVCDPSSDLEYRCTTQLIGEHVEQGAGKYYIPDFSDGKAYLQPTSTPNRTFRKIK